MIIVPKREGVIKTKDANITIRGKVTDSNGIDSVTLNRKKTPINSRGWFEQTVELKPGVNRVVVTALDKKDNLASKTIFLERDVQPASTTIINRTDENENKLALVIGNSDYIHAGKLENPANDAHDISVKLQSLGFEVITRIDAKQQQMEDAINDFGRKLVRGGVGLFFYAGHGMQIDGKNYLIPVDADLKRQTVTRPHGFHLHSLVIFILKMLRNMMKR